MVGDPMRGERDQRGLLVDFGGVLTTSVWDSFADFCRSRGLAADAVRGMFRSDPAALSELRELETGRMPEEEFERRFAERLGLEDAGGLIEAMFRGMQPSEPMVDAVRSARASGVRTGLVSNSWSTSHYDRDLLAELFDSVVISGDVGLHKPEPEIYLLAAGQLELDPSRCVFVDDLRENCEGAEAVGMTAVLHREVDATVDRLQELLGFSLPAR